MMWRLFFILLIISVGTGYIIWAFMLPDYLREGGPLVAGLISMLVLLIGFIIERWLTLRIALINMLIEAQGGQIALLVPQAVGPWLA